MVLERKNDTLPVVNKNMDISANTAAIAEVGDKKFLFVGTQTGLYKYGEDNEITSIKIPHRNYTALYFALLAAGIVAVAILVIISYFFQKRHIQKRLRRCSKKITSNIKKKEEDELTGKKKELESKLKSVSLFGIRHFKKEVSDFEIQVDESLLKRREIIDTIRTLINRKIEEINEIVSSDNRNEWDTVLLEKDRIMNEDGDEYSIDCSFNLFEKILKFEKNHFNRSIITQEMTDLQKKDFEELKYLFITKEYSKDEQRNRIKSKCEELLGKYHEELNGLKLKNNTKKAYVALLLISGKFDNADIEETMDFSRVGDDRYNIHENLKQKASRNALSEQLFENTRPKK
jgi:hypothetical protein